MCRTCAPKQRRESLRTRNRSARTHFPYEDRDLLIDAYLSRQRSIRQVSVEMACSVRTIARWLAIHEIPTRTQDEGRALNPTRPPRLPAAIALQRKTCPACGGPKTRDIKTRTCRGCRDRHGERGPNWAGREVGYTGAHYRVRNRYGPPSSHVCSYCYVKPAAHWAYDHLDPNSLLDPDEGPYSDDPSHYMPLCARCHKRFDLGIL